MPKFEVQQTTNERRNRSVATFIVLVLVGVGLLMYGTYVRLPKESAHLTDESTVATIVPEGQILDASIPVHLSLPTLQVEADFEEPLGVQPSGEIEAPKTYDRVAYYKYGPTPGEIGPAVVLGHVDSYQGPAVFFYLGQLKEGDPINITRADGSIATFSVERLERYPQSDFPTRDVYGDLPYAGLRLITCTGVYDHGALRYSHNLIVYAKLASSSAAVTE